MEICECGFCGKVFSADKEDFVMWRKQAEKLGRKSWKSTDFLDIVSKFAGECEKKEGEDKSHVLRWRKEYLDGNIGAAEKIKGAKKKIFEEQKKLDDDRELMIKLAKKLEELKEEVEKLTSGIKEDTTELDAGLFGLEERTGGAEEDIWVDIK